LRDFKARGKKKRAPRQKFLLQKSAEYDKIRIYIAVRRRGVPARETGASETEEDNA